MVLLAERLLKPLPADNQIETRHFLEAVSHLPPFFDCLRSPVSSSRAPVTGSRTRTTPTSSASTPPRPTRWPSRSTMAGSCRSSRQHCTQPPIRRTS
uniref:Glycolipid transfer protein domain-containing protein n=1 Tax=Colobus angolensis palliatus TaxID=336983 RepID=A0A2K5K5L8_COLAP